MTLYLLFQNGNLKSFGHFKNLIGFYGNIICGNINKKSDLKLLDDFKFDYIFHQASLTSVSESIEKPNLYLSDNFLNFKNILILSEYKKIKNLVFASSSAVYGNRSNIRVDFSRYYARFC